MWMSGLFLVFAGCDRHPENEGLAGPVAASSDESGESSSRVRGIDIRSEQEVQRRMFLESLVGLEVDEVDRLLEHDQQWRLLVKGMTGTEFEALLGELRDSNDGVVNHWSKIYTNYCIEKARLDPRGYADWLISGKRDVILAHVRHLGAKDPELAVEVIEKCNLSSITRGNAFGAVFEAASGEDPQRSVRVFEATRFSNFDEIESAMIGLVSGINRETATPENVHEILSGFSMDKLQTVPLGVRSVAELLVHAPVDEVLAVFPLNREPWERVAALQYLENKAHHGYRGDDEVKAFLDGDQAKALNKEEINSLRNTIGQ